MRSTRVAAGGASVSARPSAVVVFSAADEAQLASVRGLSVGIMSASQGLYSRVQFLLDLTQGARVASSAYSSAAPAVSIAPLGAGAAVRGWRAAQARAEAAPQLLAPGLLASEIGGAGYAGIAGLPPVDAVLAAGRDGHIAASSSGPASTLLLRIAALRRRGRLLVADLPGGSEGIADLRALSVTRARGELLIVLERASDARGHELLWSAVAGLEGGGGRELTSASTSQRGLIAGFDVAPTILAHLRAPIPPDMRGKPIETDGALRSASLRALMARLRVIPGRRLKALGFLMLACALLLMLARRWRAWALRTSALAVLWSPVAALVPAALEPSAAVEYATIVLVCLVLGALADALVPWPRALLAPAIVAVVALTVDALAGTQLSMRSLLGPDPVLGARFYGIGNELKSGLAVLVAAAVAAALYPGTRGRRAALAMAATGVILAVIEGAARIGAGVGGVILVSFGFAVATVMLLPGALTRRRALLVLATPLAGLVALAAIDLATAHGSGHFTGSVLDARSPGDVRDVLVRRYGAAWDELHNHAMPLATVLALTCAGLGLRRRGHLLAPVAGDPVWLAAFAGGLAASIVGALVEDSGPVLLVVGVFALGWVASYLWGRPRKRRAEPPAPVSVARSR